ncbi:MAG: helix-turn-helix domain-containing protein [Bifidobacteriaceae bacterium]|jgi:excisionase family DNA binding protein|nr:helix-turn-helix domain-containing protein [Bifidobacteriaceae bacterium]
MRTSSSEHLWTPQETADYLGVPLATLYRWRSAGSPAPDGIRLGRHLRFDPATVKDWALSRADSRRAV